MSRIDLRSNEWREAIMEISEAVKVCPLTDRALAILITDTCGVCMTDVFAVLDAMTRLEARYLKEGNK